MSGVDCGAALMASVGVLGGGMLALGHQLRAVLGRVDVLTRDIDRARHETARVEAWALGAGQALAVQRRADEALAGVDDLLDARAAIDAMLDRAAAVAESPIA